MEISITFPGGSRVDAHLNPHTIHTDQPSDDGSEGSAPTPFDTFLASIGACAGIYVLNFLRKRNLPTEGVRLLQRIQRDPTTGMVGQIDLEIQVVNGFPEKYRPAIVHAAELCAVKKHFEKPPQFNVTVT
jgi:putative redox protein